MAVGRDSATVEGWEALKAAVMTRAKGRCEVNDRDHPAQDVHHVVPRSLGGPDVLENLIAICRHHHDQVDQPFIRGRLVIAPLGEERFAWAIVRKATKWEEDPFSRWAALLSKMLLARTRQASSCGPATSNPPPPTKP